MAELLTKPGGGEERLTFCMSSFIALPALATGADLLVCRIYILGHERDRCSEFGPQMQINLEMFDPKPAALQGSWRMIMLGNWVAMVCEFDIVFAPGKIHPTSSTTLFSILFSWKKSPKLDKIIYSKPASTLFSVYPTFDLWCTCMRLCLPISQDVASC